MSTESKHTPTPWTAETYAVSTGETGWTIKYLDDGIADVWTEEDAAFIACACNAYDDLIAALRSVDGSLSRENFDTESGVRTMIRFALAKAQGY